MFARTIRLAGAGVALLAAHAGLAHSQVRSTPLNWGPGPHVFPPGARMSILSGDPARPGPFTMRVAMPHGYRIPPHYHPVDEHITVRSGTFLYGTGDRLERKAMRRLRRGESSAFPANMHHYAEASGPTTVEIASTGPYVMTYVNPADDPQKAVAKP